MSRLLLIACILLALGVALGQTPTLPQATNRRSLPFVPWKTEEPLIIAGSKAVYPRLAAIVGAKGCAYIRLIVAEDGSTRNIAFLTGNLLLMKSALDAVMNWRFAPSKQEIMTVVPICAFSGGDDPQAMVSTYQKAAEKHQDSKSLTAFAYALLFVGSPDDAAKQFRQALDLKADSTDARLGLADSLAAQGDLDGAIDAYQQGLTADPKNELARTRLADSLWYKGNLDAAIVQYGIALKTNSINISSRSRLAELLLETGDADGAIEQYKKALRGDPIPSPSGHYGLGQAYEKKGDTANALKEYKEARKEMPQNVQFQEAYNRLSSN